MMEYVATAVWFVLVLAAATFAGRVWSRILGRVYWVVMAPGVAVHEISHALACLLVGAKIQRVKLFGRDGGEVVHEKPRIPVVGKAVIAFAPLVGCSLVLVLLGALLGSNLANALRIKEGYALSSTIASFSGFFSFVEGSVSQLLRAISKAGYRQWQTYVFIYAAVCLGICIRPSLRDFRSAAVGIVSVAAIFWVADLLAGKLGHPDAVVEYVLVPAQRPLHYLISFMALVAVLTFCAWFLRLVIHRATASKPAARKPAKGSGRKGAAK